MLLREQDMTDKMNDIRPPEQLDGAVDAVALEWFQYLRHGDVHEDELMQWEDWLNASSDHKKAFERAERLWIAAGRVDYMGLEPALDEVLFHSDKEDSGAHVSEVAYFLPNKKQHKFSSPLLWAASIALIAGLFWAVQFMIGGYGVLTGKQAVATVLTARAEHRTVNLFDGTNVTVGASSKIEVDFSGDVRRVALSSGEVYFDVAPDAAKPFIVTTPSGDIRVVGTAFNIRVAGDRTVVTVTEGKVDVSRSEKVGKGKPEGTALRLGAGSAITMSGKAGPLSSGDVKEAFPLSWMEGRLVYRSEPLRYVIEDVNRYINGHIRLKDDKVAQFSYSGVVSPKAIEEWLDGLPGVFPLAVEKQEEGAIIIRSRL